MSRWAPQVISLLRCCTQGCAAAAERCKIVERQPRKHLPSDCVTQLRRGNQELVWLATCTGSPEESDAVPQGSVSAAGQGDKEDIKSVGVQLAQNLAGYVAMPCLYDLGWL